MSLQVGAVLSGAKWRYRLVERLGDHTVFSSVFKAEVLPGIQRTTPVKLAVVKTTDPNNPVKRNSLLRELHYYGRPAIISCPSIRKMYDTVNSPSNWTAENPFCLALEWMESTFADVPSVIPLQSPVLAQTIKLQE